MTDEIDVSELAEACDEYRAAYWAREDRTPDVVDDLAAPIARLRAVLTLTQQQPELATPSSSKQLQNLEQQPGDKVRAGDTVEVTQTLRGKVYGVDSDGFVRYETEHGQFGAYADDTVTITVVERADDPSRDLVGTIAELDGEVWIKHEYLWKCFSGCRSARRSDQMRGRKVTGAVTGTPAATAQQAEPQRFRVGRLPDPSNGNRPTWAVVDRTTDWRLFTTCRESAEQHAANLNKRKVVGP